MRTVKTGKFPKLPALLLLLLILFQIPASSEPDQIRIFEEKYDRITKIGFEEDPPPLIPENQTKKPGRKRQSKSKNLLDRFADYKNDILRFMHDFEVPFENNLAERDV
jgi:transposase